MSAKNNIEKLPEECYGVLLRDYSLIKIKAGEMGYYAIGQWYAQRELQAGKKIDDICDELNAELGVTRAQRAAMEWGSQFGWETPLSNPENYDEEGFPIKSNLKTQSHD